MDTDQILTIVKNALTELKLTQISVFDVRHLTSIADYMIIASGTSSRQVSALAAHLTRILKESGIKPLSVEGEKQGEWVLVDIGDTIIHIMHPQIRQYYQLERLWGIDIALQDSALH